MLLVLSVAVTAEVGTHASLSLAHSITNLVTKLLTRCWGYEHCYHSSDKGTTQSREQT